MPKLAFSYRVFLEVVVAIAMVFLLLPIVFVVLNSIGPRGLAQFPPQELNLEAYATIPVRWLWATVASVGLGLISTFLGSILGICAALAVARGSIRWPALVDGLLRSPMQVPALVLGVAFLQFYNWLAFTTGLDLRGSYFGLTLAHTVVSVPFIMVVVLARLRTLNANLELAAEGLGATGLQTFFRVTLPLLLPAVLSGSFFAFLLSVDNVPLSLFIIGAGQALLPVDLFNSIQFDLTRTIYAVATLVCLATTIVIAFFFKRLTSVVVSAR